MNSKEALRTIFINCKEKMLDKNGCIVNSENLVKTILQDLDRLEKLEKENQELKELFKKHFVYSKKTHTIRKSIKNFDYETIKGVLEND